MSDRPDLILLMDIQESLEKILSYTNGVSYEEFFKNSMLREAVERNIEIIGEACNAITQDFKNRHKDIEWYKPVAMRNRLIHGYFSIDIPMLYNTVITIIPEFKIKVDNLLNN